MSTHRAFLGCFFAFKNVAAVSTFPLEGCIFFEHFVFFQVSARARLRLTSAVIGLPLETFLYHLSTSGSFSSCSLLVNSVARDGYEKTGIKMVRYENVAGPRGFEPQSPAPQASVLILTSGSGAKTHAN